jgi:hypothetical protein
MSELYLDNKFRILKLLMYLCLAINGNFTLLSFRYNVIMTRLIDLQLKEMKQATRTIFVEFNASEANRIRLQEFGIPYVERYIEKNPSAKSIINSTTLYLIP